MNPASWSSRKMIQIWAIVILVAASAEKTASRLKSARTAMGSRPKWIERGAKTPPERAARVFGTSARAALTPKSTVKS